MRNLTNNELGAIAGAATMTHVGNDIIFTLNASDGAINFNNMELSWDGQLYSRTPGLIGCPYMRTIHNQGELVEGYYVYYSMDPSGIAQYTLKAAGN